jgi:hypothetical protein
MNMNAKFRGTRNRLGKGIRLCVAIFFSLSIAFSTSNIDVLAHQMDVNQTNRERVSVDEGSVTG